MSRTFKDKPYRVLEREALEHGYTYLRHNWMHPTEPPTLEGDVTAYAYSQSRKAHIPSGRRWHSWHDYEDDRYPDYVGRHTVRDRCRLAVRPAGCRHMAAGRIRPVAGRALGRSGRKETAPVQGERDRGSETAAGPVDPSLPMDGHAA